MVILLGDLSVSIIKNNFLGVHCLSIQLTIDILLLLNAVL